MSDDYSAEVVKKLLFPPWEKDDEGTWSRRWTLRVPRGDAHDLDSNSLGEPVLHVEAAFHPSSGIVEARTIARGDPMSDEIYFWATYRFLARLDAAVGPVAAVQGQPRDWWPPFRESGGATKREGTS